MLFFVGFAALGLLIGASVDLAAPDGHLRTTHLRRTNCSVDLDCTATANAARASVDCEVALAAVASQPMEWTEPGGQKFSRYRWLAEPGGPVVYEGDNLVLADASGSYVNHQYACAVDTGSRRALRVLKVSLAPGRLPNP